MSLISDLWSSWKLRLLRSAVVWAFGILAAKYQNNIWYVSVAPVLSTIGKYLRDKYPGKWEWLPF